MEQRVCGRPCQVYGFTFPDGEIVIDEAMAIGADPVATSILVHELTHFLQMKSIAHPGPITCRIWNDREREAFDVQTRWLRDTSVNVHVFSVEMARLNLAGNAPHVHGITPALRCNNLGPKDEGAGADCSGKPETRSLE